MGKNINGLLRSHAKPAADALVFCDCCANESFHSNSLTRAKARTTRRDKRTLTRRLRKFVRTGSGVNGKTLEYALAVPTHQYMTMYMSHRLSPGVIGATVNGAEPTIGSGGDGVGV